MFQGYVMPLVSPTLLIYIFFYKKTWSSYSIHASMWCDLISVQSNQYDSKRLQISTNSLGLIYKHWTSDVPTAAWKAASLDRPPHRCCALRQGLQWTPCGHVSGLIPDQSSDTLLYKRGGSAQRGHIKILLKQRPRWPWVKPLWWQIPSDLIG